MEEMRIKKGGKRVQEVSIPYCRKGDPIFIKKAGGKERASEKKLDWGSVLQKESKHAQEEAGDINRRAQTEGKGKVFTEDPSAKRRKKRKNGRHLKRLYKRKSSARG